MVMTPKKRKMALLGAEVSVASLARQLACAGPHVSQVLHGQRRSQRVEAAIAKAIGKPVSVVFPPPRSKR